MQKQSLQRCKKVWDEKLYHYARKRFNRINNIGWYRMFMSRLDFLHDNYLRFISKNENFEQSDTFEQYYKKFNIRVIAYRKNSYSKKSLQGQEFFSRFFEFVEQPEWVELENNFVEYPKDIVSTYLEHHYYSKKIWEGYTFIDIAKEKNISPTTARNKFLKEAELLKNNNELKEILLQYV